jgi:hypothetical protein
MRAGMRELGAKKTLFLVPRGSKNALKGVLEDQMQENGSSRELRVGSSARVAVEVEVE